MEYENRKPVTKSKRESRRQRERAAVNKRQESSRKRRSMGVGNPNELGVAEGQNGEQQIPTDPNYARSIGRTGH